MAIVDHFAGRPILAAEPGEHRAIIETLQPIRRDKRKTWLSFGLGGGFQLGIEVGDDLLECLDCLLDRGDLHQLPARDRARAILQGDDQVAPLLLELNER
jgi:hypothetical protein